VPNTPSVQPSTTTAAAAAAPAAMALQAEFQGAALHATYESCLLFLVEICSLLCSFNAVPQPSEGTPAKLAALDAPAATVLPAADCDQHIMVLDDAMTVSSHDLRSDHGDDDADNVSEPSITSKDGYDDPDASVPEKPSGEFPCASHGNATCTIDDATDFTIVDQPEDWILIR